MSFWISLSLDTLLIILIGVGIVQAGRLIRHLEGLREDRIEMDKFIREFNATLLRAESGIKNLRQAARDSGDDLEKLVDKATQLHDELGFMVESADQIASRLSQGATQAIRPSVASNDTTSANPSSTERSKATANQGQTSGGASEPSSRAEKELMQALEKLG